MTIQAVASTPPQIVASVGESKIDVVVSGGFGPAGFTSIARATDAAVSDAADGDILRYSAGKWRNYPDASLVDGGNW